MGDDESVKECLKIATREMKIAGFTKIIYSSVDKDNKKQASIYADHSKRPATISYRCFEDLKVFTWGVSAIDDDVAWREIIQICLMPLVNETLLPLLAVISLTCGIKVEEPYC